MPEAGEGSRWSKTALITAVVLAVVAVIIVNVYWSGQRRKQRAGLVQVAETKRRLERDQKLEESDIRLVEVPATDPNVLKKWIKADQLYTVLGKALIQPVEKNQRLTWSHFSPRQGDSLFDLVEPGTVAASFPVDRKTSPGRLMRPGIYVDVLATMPPNTARGTPAVTVTLLRRVLVVAVSGRTAHETPTEQYREYSTATLQVTPDEAQKLATVNSYLRDGFTFVLRNRDDKVTDRSENLDAALKRLGLSVSARRTPG